MPRKIKRKEETWEPFRLANTLISSMPEHLHNAFDEPGERVFVNNLYTVNAGVVETLDGSGTPILHLSIKRNDKAAVHDWRHLQRIKNELAGPETEAVEVYPAESRLVDTANSFHLWCFPPGIKVPVGYTERAVVDGDDVYREGHARQRPWPAGQRPDDCLTPEQAQEAIEKMAAEVSDESA